MSEASESDIRVFNGPRRLEKAMHMLEGIVRGVTHDRRLNDDEMIVLSDWIGENFEFRNKHPFTEVVPRLEKIVNGSVFDEEERADILWLCEQFTTGSKHFDEVTKDLQILHGICAVSPTIQFEGRSFCFTGKPKRGPKKVLQKVVEEKRGTVKANVAGDLNYLVIGADGNECWAYSAYGRKIEEAIEYRKSGEKITIVHEFDFWDAVEDAGRTPDE